MRTVRASATVCCHKLETQAHLLEFAAEQVERKPVRADVGRLAERTQVLFYTNHMHLVDVARETAAWAQVVYCEQSAAGERRNQSP